MEIENPDPPGVKVIQPVERAEPPQIKGPVELPQRKKGEEVQLGRPDPGKQNLSSNLNCLFNKLCVIGDAFLKLSRCCCARGGGPSPRTSNPS